MSQSLKYGGYINRYSGSIEIGIDLTILVIFMREISYGSSINLDSANNILFCHFAKYFDEDFLSQEF
jgi:hypothetical protein